MLIAWAMVLVLFKPESAKVAERCSWEPYLFATYIGAMLDHDFLFAGGYMMDILNPHCTFLYIDNANNNDFLFTWWLQSY